MTNNTTKTLTIAGRPVTLETGFFYLAFVGCYGGSISITRFPLVTARDRNGRRISEGSEPSVVLDGMTNEQANEFLEAFNDVAADGSPTFPRFWGVEDDDRQAGDFVETELH